MREAVNPAGLNTYLHEVVDACNNLDAAADWREVARAAMGLECEGLLDLPDGRLAFLVRRLGGR
jgi:hypothetical protein